MAARDLFGTDGVRGLAGTYPLDDEGARRIGMAVGTLFATPGQKVVIGCDPRESSAGLVHSLTSGLNSVGVDVVSAGVLPTPGLAYLTREHEEFAAGVMVTASHNSFEYNGVKVFDGNGGKLPDSIETDINRLIDEGTPEQGEPGKVSEDFELIKQYEDFLVSSTEGLQLNGMQLAIDSANGAACGLAERVFTRLGGQVTPLADKPDGKNINSQCGATNTEALRKYVTDHKFDLGIAFDGDADRVIMVDSLGREVKGDYLLYILAVSMGVPGVVATVMSNQGFERELNKRGIKLIRTKVGDRYVLEGLLETGFKLGGEEAGHIIMVDLLQTGDGMLAAVQTLKALVSSGRNLAEWCDSVELVPQALINVPLPDKAVLDNPSVRAFIEDQNSSLQGGRLLIRPSGTEPVVRVMVESPDAEEKARQIASELEKIINGLNSEVGSVAA